VNADWQQYYELGEEALQEGDYACAETMWLAAYSQAQKFDKADPRYTITLEGLAEALWHQGKYEGAEELCKQTLETFKVIRGPQDPDVGVAANNLAMLYKAQQKYADAEPLYRQAIHILGRALGNDHPDVQNLHANHKELLYLMGQAPEQPAKQASLTADKLTKSGQYQTIAVESMDKLYETGPQMAIGSQPAEMTWNQYREAAETALRNNDFPTAEAMWTGALRRAGKFEERDPRLTITLESLSEVLWRQSKYSNAEPLCKWTMQIYERTLGPNHPDVGIISNNLAMLYHAQRKYAEAEPLYKRALPIRTKALGSDHPAVTNLVANYQNLLRAMGRAAEAERVRYMAASITNGRWTRSGSYQQVTIAPQDKLHEVN